MELKTTDPKLMRIFSNDRDILRDLFTYIDYAEERKVKRMTRSNEIPQADLQRLAKLFGNLGSDHEETNIDAAQWIYFIDRLALHLKLVHYDIKGEYRGYSSTEPTFLGNYIIVNTANVYKFLQLAPVEQEKQILTTLIHARSHSEYDRGGENEFYQTSVLGELDGFPAFGSGTGIMPTLKFPEIRLFLLDLLKECPAGQWISTESLIAYLKANHRYFLIPEKLPTSKNKWEAITSRYSNFYEGLDHWQRSDQPIADDETNAFERVEGRYVERFLENIPLIMRFVDLAYDPNPYKGVLPERNRIKAFRINERFLRLMNGEMAQPKVTIQPNFDVIVESDFYPVSLIRQISALGSQVSNPGSGHGAYVGIFLLNKASVAAAQVKDSNLDVIEFLTKLSGRDLPPNVQIELNEWAGHADQFTLYEGFALLEAAEVPPEIEIFISERITPTLSLVRSPEKIFPLLETLGEVPVQILHPQNELAPVADLAQSVFPKEIIEVNAPKMARPVRVGMAVIISYQFPDAETFDAAKKVLAELRCPFQSDPTIHTISLQQKNQYRFDEAVTKLAGEYAIEIDR